MKRDLFLSEIDLIAPKTINSPTTKNEKRAEALILNSESINELHKSILKDRSDKKRKSEMQLKDKKKEGSQRGERKTSCRRCGENS
jgi:hypothetical protein